MIYKITILFGALLLIFVAYKSENKLVRKLAIPIGITFYLLGILAGALFNHWEIKTKKELAILESEEKLAIVLEKYPGIASAELSKIKALSKQITITPLSILSMAAEATKGDFKITEDDLIEKYYVYTWFSSNFELYDKFFRGDEFQRRKRIKHTEGLQWVEEKRVSGNGLYKADVEISFKEYNFERQAFEVKFQSAAGYPIPSSINKFQGSGFTKEDIDFINSNSAEHKLVEFEPISIVLFNDGRRRVDGAVRRGSNVFSTSFPDVHEPVINVSEGAAQSINTELFTIFGEAYFDVKILSTLRHSGGLYLKCDFMDVFTDESRSEIFKTIPCDSLNKTVLSLSR